MIRRRSEFAASIVAGLTAVALVYAMVVSERAEVTHALQLSAHDAAAPGGPVPVRAFVFDGIGLGEAPALVAADVRIELRDGDRVLASAELARSETVTCEGALVAPERAGRYQLYGVARIDGERVASAGRPLLVGPEPSPPARVERLAPPLAHFSLGPIVTEPSQVPPPSFEARVSGGVCIPEHPCRVLVDLGEEGDDVRVGTSPSVSWNGTSEREGRFVRVTVVVTGPEGEAELVAVRAGVVVARRSLRLPVALATPLLELPAPFVRAGRLAAQLAPPPGRSALVLDLSRDGLPVRTLTLPSGTLDEQGRRWLDLPFDGLPDGLYRLSLRADPYPTDHGIDRLVRLGAVSTPPFATDAPLAFAYAAAALEAVPLAQPALVSGLEGDLAELEAGRGLVRGIAIVAMLAAGGLLVVGVMRRGLASDAEAAAILREAGVEPDERGRRRQRLSLILTVLALAFALLVGVALLTARSLLG